MEQTKDWYKSKGAWGGIVAAVVGILAMCGVGAAQGEEESIVELIMQVVAVGAGIVAFIGRMVAKSQIKPPGGGVSGGAGASPLLTVLCLACVLAAVVGV